MGVEWEMPGEVGQEKGPPPAVFLGGFFDNKGLPEIFRDAGSSDGKEERNEDGQQGRGRKAEFYKTARTCSAVSVFNDKIVCVPVSMFLKTTSPRAYSSGAT